jgi:mannan endo-1,4-beta-mannosidase
VNGRLRALVIVTAVLTLCGGITTAAYVGSAPPLYERVKVGAYVHLDGKPFQDPVAAEDLKQFESQTGKLDIVHYFFTWGWSFRQAVTSNLDGRDLMLSLKPDQGLVWSIKDGGQDGYIDQFAAEAAAYERPVYLRFGHEMNGDWMSYSAGRDGGPSAEHFKDAWRRVVDRFRAQGATNVRFIWCPNESDFPDRDGNHLEDYWPGEEYVDIVGFDAYNWTDALPRRGSGDNRTFDEIVKGPYERIGRLTDKEVWLCEFGTVEPGKAEWIEDMFESRSFPRLTGLIYFSENDQRDVQRDWRLDSSPDAARAWRDGVEKRQNGG